MMKKGKIAEFSIMKRVNNEEENNYYFVGKTLVKIDGNSYYDLINKEYLPMFDQNYERDGYKGIWFKKEESDFKQDVKNYKMASIYLFLNYLKELEKILASEKNLDLHLGQYFLTLHKLIKKSSHKIDIVLMQIKNYLQLKYPESKAIEAINAFKEMVLYREKVLLKYKINYKILADLNSYGLSRLNPQKSMQLYLQNNNIDNPNCENWKQTNSHRSLKQ